MIEKFFAKFIANISEELLMDLFKVMVREYLVKKKKDGLHTATSDLKMALQETVNAEMTDDEKNQKLSDAGRTVIDRLRDN